MHTFDYNAAMSDLMRPQIVQALTRVYEHKGKQDLYLTSKPDVLNTLVNVAKIQSTGSSNRIEGISTTDARLQVLMTQDVTPRNRDEEEILGYRRVLDLIHESYEGIDVKPGVILQLHAMLYRGTRHQMAGKWKDSDNVIAEMLPSGEMVTRFTPTPAFLVPDAMDRLCEAYTQALKDSLYDPLLLSCIFAFDFVSIHPFVDGNGRMSRLLTLLTLYRCGFLVGKYVSIEHEIEQSKQGYYNALAQSSIGWHDDENDYYPFVRYLLTVITACYEELDRRVSLMTGGATTEDVIREILSTSIVPLSKREMLDIAPDLSARSIERVLARLQQEGLVRKVGAARATKYHWVG